MTVKHMHECPCPSLGPKYMNIDHVIKVYFLRCRGSKGFIAINAGSSGTLNANINTGLPQGTYCDVISGNYENGHCTGTTVHVGGNGHAHFNIDASSTDPVVAIHIGKTWLFSIAQVCPYVTERELSIFMATWLKNLNI